jgi:hypothetical protein
MTGCADNDLIPLDEAAKLIPGADANTLKRLARRGKLTVYRPGKAYLTTAADVREAVEKCRVVPKIREKPSSETSNPLGLSPADLASIALDLELERVIDKKQKR